MPGNVDTVSLSSIMSTVIVAGTCAVLTKNPRSARLTALAHLSSQGHVDINTAFKCTAFFMGSEIDGISWRNFLLPNGTPLAEHSVFDANTLSMRQCVGTVRDSWKLFNECHDQLSFSQCVCMAILKSHRDIGMDSVPVDDLDQWMALMANFYEPIGLDMGLLEEAAAEEDDDEADDDDDDEADDGPDEVAPAA